MEYKIIKYKLKKKKIENKIKEFLVSKKKLYSTNIVNSIGKIKFIPNILDSLIQGDKGTQNLIYIIVTGIYASGKSTLILELENFFGSSNVVSKINLTLPEEFNTIDKVKQTNNKGIILLECDIDLLKQVNEFLSNSTVYIINIMVQSKNYPSQYKNKLINKIFLDFRLKTNQFNKNFNQIIKYIKQDNSYISDKSYISDNSYISDKLNKLEETNIYRQINFDKSMLSDKNFNFLDQYIEQIEKYYSVEKTELLLDLNPDLDNFKNSNIDLFYF